MDSSLNYSGINGWFCYKVNSQAQKPELKVSNINQISDEWNVPAFH